MKTMPNKKVCTIYKITSVRSGKVYIGQTWRTTKERAKNGGTGYIDSPHLWNAIQLYGWVNFTTEVICMTKSQLDADYLEDFLIKKFGSNNGDIGYNIKDGGSNGKLS